MHVTVLQGMSTQVIKRALEQSIAKQHTAAEAAQKGTAGAEAVPPKAGSGAAVVASGVATGPTHKASEQPLLGAAAKHSVPAGAAQTTGPPSVPSTPQGVDSPSPPSLQAAKPAGGAGHSDTAAAAADGSVSLPEAAPPQACSSADASTLQDCEIQPMAGTLGAL